MIVPPRPRVLLVDDEPAVLEGLSLHLHRPYDLVTATSATAALAMVHERGPFAVVVSDMRMPGMDGATFLALVRRAAPSTVRLLLTGHADVEAAASAINEGQVFRFLTKPCPAEQLQAALAAAVEQHRLQEAEHALLEQTLRGAVQVLTDMLSLASPLAFGHAERVRRRALELARALKMPHTWPLEVAAMLSHLGSLAVPDEVLERAWSGAPLDPSQKAALARVPQLTDSLLARIPRLEPVRDILARLNAGPATEKVVPAQWPAPATDPAGDAAEVLRIALDFDALVARGTPVRLALDTLRGRGLYVAVFLDAFAALLGAADAAEEEVRELPLATLQAGMITADEIRTRAGLLLVTRGFEVTPSLLHRLHNFAAGTVKEPVRVIVGRKSGEG